MMSTKENSFRGKVSSKPRVLYGEANFSTLIRENGYYVDKTEYIRLLENYKRPVFLRPRRFGKSFLCTTLAYYYDILEKENFQELFGKTSIGRNPTPEHNQYMVLSLDFSDIGISGGFEKIETRFNDSLNIDLEDLLFRYSKYFGDSIQIDFQKETSLNLKRILNSITQKKLPPLYIIIDEYDNFSNLLITSYKDGIYQELTADDSFFKSFFKTLKRGFKEKSVARVFITGVLPITIDDLSSAYNIAQFLTLEKRFESMMGFTQKEVDHLLDRIYKDYHLDPQTRQEIDSVIRNNYNGYHLIDPEGDALYNSTILMYFLEKLCQDKEIPSNLTDLNLKTSISWVKRLTGSNPESTSELVKQLTVERKIPFDPKLLSEKFTMSMFFEKSFFPISFYYLGMLTILDEQFFHIPNLNMKSIFVEYFNEVHHIDVSTKYAEIMAGFLTEPNLERLFTGYWKEYITQLPEAIFQQVNENFYRTTFFELCRRHLSKYFTWAVENSYTSGRTDLEFMGKYHTRFAGLRYLIEFKYYSNTEFKKREWKISEFQALEKDIKQLKEYRKEWEKEYSTGQSRSYLVYCFGNQGFRVFPQ